MFVDTFDFVLQFPENNVNSILNSSKIAGGSFFASDKVDDGFQVYNRFKLRSTQDDFSKIKSYDREINFKKINFNQLYFTLSVPKYYFNHNAFTFDCDLRQFIKDFVNDLEVISCSKLQLEEVFIKRIDITASFRFNSQLEIDEALDFFTTPRLAQRQNGTRRYNTSIHFASNYHSYKLYCKQPELKKNKKHTYLTEEQFEEVYKNASLLFRYEHCYRVDLFKRKLGFKHSNTFTLDYFLNSDFYKNFDIIEDIKEVFGDFSTGERVLNVKDAFDLLKYSFGRRYEKYFTFLSGVFSIGLEATKKNISKQLYRYYKLKLFKAGIDIEKLYYFVSEKKQVNYSDTNYFTKERIVYFDKN